jgi:peptidoglycan/LPS O-acetylase OafA/YrhL
VGEFTATRRVVELDSLRAIAALNLVLFHFTHVYSVKYGFAGALGFEWPYGKYGVQLFFMLSGLVNAMTLSTKAKPAAFLASRLIRIVPLYWIVIGMNLLLSSYAPLCHQWPTDAVAANLTIVPNLFGYQCIEPVTWTLQVELLFYGWLLLMFAAGAFRHPSRTVWLLLSIVITVCGAIQCLESGHRTGPLIGCLILMRELMILEFLPLFVIGILLNEIRCRRGVWWQHSIGIGAAMVVFHAFDRHDHNPLATILLFGILVLSSYGRLPILRLRPLVFVSTISYSLYLLHNNLGCVFIYHVNQAGLPPLAALVLAIAFVTSISMLMTKYVEQPLSRWLKTRWQRVNAALGARRLTSAGVA